MANPGFKLMQASMTESDRELPVSSFTGAIGDLLELTVGSTTWAAATASSKNWTLKAVCTASSTAASTVLAHIVKNSDVWMVESANASDVAANGDRMLLTDSNTVNNTGTDNTSVNVCFLQLGTIGATGDKQIYGYVLAGNGVDPAAT